MSYRTDINATYDRTLLSSVPDPTRAERQEGYNVDLLDEGRDRRAPSPPAPDRQPTDQQPLTAGYSPGAIAVARKEGYLENGSRPAAVAKKPWYRTKWGITAIVIAVVLVVGGIIGGAVGGTQHHSSNKSSNGGNGNAGSGTPNPNGTTGGDTTISPNHSGSVGGTTGTTTGVNPDSESGPTSGSRPSATEAAGRPSAVTGQGTVTPQAAPSPSSGVAQSGQPLL